MSRTKTAGQRPVSDLMGGRDPCAISVIVASRGVGGSDRLSALSAVLVGATRRCPQTGTRTADTTPAKNLRHLSISHPVNRRISRTTVSTPKEAYQCLSSQHRGR
jgi:hypothetical protein